MASYVERVLDFMERVTKIAEIDKQIREDVEWAIETISANKLYSGGLDGFYLQDSLPEVKAWKDMIYVQSLPVNKEEQDRLKQYEEKKVDKKENKGIIVRQAIVEKIITNGGPGSGFMQGDHGSSKKKDFDDSKATLLKETLSQVNGKIHPVSDGAGNK